MSEPCQHKEMCNFRSKVEDNWQKYREKLLALPKEELLEKAEEIAAMKYCREMLTSRAVSQDLREYLNQFVDPLRVVADAWLNEQNVDLTEEFGHVLWTLRDRQDAEQEYEMEQTM